MTEKNNMELTAIDVTNLDIFINQSDLRHDLHVYIEYIQNQSAKRGLRGDWINKSDALRLAKLMTNPEAEEQIKSHGHAKWLGFIANLGKQLKLINTPNNYAAVRPEKYRQFLELSALQQEEFLLNNFVYCNSQYNEFFTSDIFSRSTCFSNYGSNSGVIPLINFTEVRRFLLKLLAECQSGIWYSTASLVEYLKKNHPYFIVPKKPKYRTKWEQEQNLNRYDNFREGQNTWLKDSAILDSAPEAFERVEGRYLERFLEQIPLIMRYIDVAYSREKYTGAEPTRNYVQAFRVNERFLSYMRGDIPAPKITIQPNFEIYVESPFYPFTLLAKLLPLTEVVSEDVVTVLRLHKQKIMSQVAKDESLDVAALLASLSDRPLPQNIQIELREWSSHAEKFILYDGFGLLEGEDQSPAISQATFETISPTLRIVRLPATLFMKLEQADLVPWTVIHSDNELKSLPKKAKTVFSKEVEAKAKPKAKKQPITLMRQVAITLFFRDSHMLEEFHKVLLEANCPVEANTTKLTLTYTKQYENLVEAAFKQLGKDYLITLEDIKT